MNENKIKFKIENVDIFPTEVAVCNTVDGDPRTML